MKKISYIISLASIAVLSFSCVHLMPLPLDTAVDNDPYYTINNKPNPEYIDKFTATEIFGDEIKNTWGFEKDACRDFTVATDVKHEGESSLLLQWDKSKKGCDWIGVGIAWNNWQVIDMSNIIDSWALTLWVRTKTGKLPNIPLSFNFIDKASKPSEYVSVSNKFYEGSGIDTTWKQVIIPLSYFRFKAKGLNLNEIHQIIIQFDGTASIYVDEFKFVEMSTLKNIPGVSGGNKAFSATNIFTDEVKNAWGIEKDACREFTTSTDVKKQGGSSLYMKWDKTQKGCDVINAGFAWNNWNSVNVSDIINNYALHFWIRTKQSSVQSIPLFFSFLDDGSNSTENISIINKYFTGDNIDDKWKEVTIPLTAFRFKEIGLNLLEIKQLVMTCEGSADIYLDELQLINIKK